ncbi:MAG: hypothetical protein J7501_17505, partial [Bdellovibrio sp.]|nr:hypothetical protein [Bdellovibrio sp.]
MTLTTTPVDLDSYDIEGFKTFIAKYSFDEKAQLSHFHEIKISQSKLVAIASGEKNVEIRVISKAGNYV